MNIEFAENNTNKLNFLLSMHAVNKQSRDLGCAQIFGNTFDLIYVNDIECIIITSDQHVCSC